MYASGKIPGGYASEGRVWDAGFFAWLIAQLSAICGYFNEIQVIAQSFPSDKTQDADIAVMIASAALAISPTPFNGPIGAARVGFINGEYVTQLWLMKQSDLDLVVAGTKSAVLMVESEAKELSEDQNAGGRCFMGTSGAGGDW